MHDPESLPPVVICFRDEDMAAATSAFAGTVAVERHNGTLIGARNVTRLYAEFCPWLLILPPGPEGVLALLHWSSVSRTRTRRLEIPPPFRTVPEMVESGADPLSWLADELTGFGFRTPEPLACPRGR